MSIRLVRFYHVLYVLNNNVKIWQHAVCVWRISISFNGFNNARIYLFFWWFCIFCLIFYIDWPALGSFERFLLLQKGFLLFPDWMEVQKCLSFIIVKFIVIWRVQIILLKLWFSLIISLFVFSHFQQFFLFHDFKGDSLLNLVIWWFLGLWFFTIVFRNIQTRL